MFNRISNKRIPAWLVELSLLGLIIAFAAILRFYKLGEWSFWGDEAFTVSSKEDGFNYTLIRRSLATDLIRFTVANFGLTEWTARLVPAIVGILTIPLIYFPTRKLFGKETALLAGLFLAFSPWHLYWSQNARFYTLLLLFYSLGLLLFHIAMEEDRPWLLLSSLVLFGFAARERLIALFFVPVVVIYLILLWLLPFKKPKGFHARNLILFLSPIIIAGIFFAGPYVANLGGWFEGFGRINTSPFWILAGTVFYINLPIVILASFGCLYLLVKKDRGALLFGINAVFPLVAIAILSMIQYSANRYAFITLTSWLLLAALAVRELFRNVQGIGRILAAGVLTLLILAPLSEDILYFQYQNGNRDNWKAAFEYIESHREVGDIVFSQNPDVSNFYLDGDTHYIGNWDPSSYSSQSRVWIVEDMNVAELHPQVLAWLKEKTVEKANFDVNVQARNFKMRVYLYDPEFQD
jgi:mannosyltransferase